ncbi:hypothetical protein GE061_014707 [Apolygus lucorum]|uniref:Uncharacterized protein n=1 Tax=Apolygus lucorum TaxID=248454 RepID=A0A6A4JIP3_APOLU|nr:hypothetical protein GE061_014707 [Apolygus lucorum]
MRIFSCKLRSEFRQEVTTKDLLWLSEPKQTQDSVCLDKYENERCQQQRTTQSILLSEAPVGVEIIV